MLRLIPLPQTDQPEGKNPAEFCAALGRGHEGGGERIGHGWLTEQDFVLSQLLPPRFPIALSPT
jgi:hypothetical protein